MYSTTVLSTTTSIQSIQVAIFFPKACASLIPDADVEGRMLLAPVLSFWVGVRI